MTTIKNKIKNSDNAKVDMETGEITETRVPNIYTSLTANLRPKKMEENKQPSMTVPGQTLTIVEMIARHRKGLPISESTGATYQEGDTPLQNLDHMDQIDRQTYIDSVADALVNVRAKIDAETTSKKEKEYVAKFNAAVQEELKKFTDNNRKTVTDLKTE